MANVSTIIIDFQRLVRQIEALSHSDPQAALQKAQSLLRWAAALPFGNDPVANTQRFALIEAARKLVTDLKLLIVHAGGSAGPHNGGGDGDVVPIKKS